MSSGVQEEERGVRTEKVEFRKKKEGYVMQRVENGKKVDD